MHWKSILFFNFLEIPHCKSLKKQDNDAQDRTASNTCPATITWMYPTTDSSTRTLLTWHHAHDFCLTSIHSGSSFPSSSFILSTFPVAIPVILQLDYNNTHETVLYVNHMISLDKDCTSTLKVYSLSPIHPNLRRCILIHSFYLWHYPFINTQISQCSPNYLPSHPVNCFFQNKSHSRVFFIASISHSTDGQTMKIASAVLFPAINGNYMLLVFTIFLILSSGTLSRSFTACSSNCIALCVPYVSAIFYILLYNVFSKHLSAYLPQHQFSHYCSSHHWLPQHLFLFNSCLGIPKPWKSIDCQSIDFHA